MNCAKARLVLQTKTKSSRSPGPAPEKKSKRPWLAQEPFVDATLFLKLEEELSAFIGISIWL